jgi:transposase
MPRTVEIKPSHTPSQLRCLAASGKNANQSRRLLSITAVLDGISRADAARIGGMDRQTLREWVHRFNAQGPAGPKDSHRRGNPRRLSAAQQADLSQIVEIGPGPAVNGVVRCRVSTFNVSSGGRFHPSAAWFRTRYSSFIAASSLGK